MGLESNSFEVAMSETNDLTLPGILARSAERFPERPSLSYYDGEPMSYRAFKERVDEIAAFLSGRGIAHGDRVAILSENGPHWGVAFFAATTLGAVAVPILADFASPEVLHVLRHSEAKAVFVSEKQYAKLEDAAFDHLKLRILIDDFTLIDADTSRDRLRKLIADGEQELRKILNKALKWVGRHPDRVREDDLASIIYTSGTTGHTKGVMLSHRSIVGDAAATVKVVEVNSEDRFLSLLPLAHVYECTLGLVAPVRQGSSVSYIRKPPSAAVLLPALQAVRPTIVLSVPLIIEKMVRAKVFPALEGKRAVRWAAKIPSLRRTIYKAAGRKLQDAFGGSLKLFCIGGAALAPEVEAFLREAGFPYAIGYGLTETSPLVTASTVAGTRLRSAGQALSGVEIRILAPDPQNGEGEILVRGITIMKGYYKDPEKTAAVLTPEGWLRTGDLGCLDADGYLTIKGRLKNVIIGPSGENIYPEIIESIINRQEPVAESLVYERDGQLTARVHLDGEKMDALITQRKFTEAQTREYIKTTLADIKRRVNENVAAFSRLSRIIEQTEPFEKTATQKIKRFLYLDDGPISSN
jgi:long-chain acyl-CoA synthetase